jgi:hypothetical protein
MEVPKPSGRKMLRGRIWRHSFASSLFCIPEKEGHTILLNFGKPPPRKLDDKKKINGHKFFTILGYLHCCSMENQPVGDDYDPKYKVKETKEYLEEQYNRLYIPGQQLSLDKTLIRAFGRI